MRRQSEIEKSCIEAFELVTLITKDKIVNHALTTYPRENFYNAFQLWEIGSSGKKAIAAKHWLTFLFVFALVFKESFINKSGSLVFPIFTSILFFYMMCSYKKYFGTLPLESIGTNIFLDQNNAKLCEQLRRHDIADLQANNLSPLRIFSNNALDKAFRNRELNFNEHNAILRGLFALKNKSFDCVSISALVVLSLIEKRLAATIIRVLPRKVCYNAHHFVIVNLDELSILNDITTWNNSAILIDSWYGICVTAEQIKNDPNFFIKYHLLNLNDKVISMRIRGDKPSSGYLFAVEKFKQLRSEYMSNPTSGSSHLEILMPGRCLS